MCPSAATRRHGRNQADLKSLGPARGFVMCRVIFPPSLGTPRRQEPCPTRRQSINRRLIKDRRLFPFHFPGPRQLIPRATGWPPSLRMPGISGARRKSRVCWLGLCSGPPGACSGQYSLLRTRQLRIREDEFGKGHTKLPVNLFSYAGH